MWASIPPNFHYSVDFLSVLWKITVAIMNNEKWPPLQNLVDGKQGIKALNYQFLAHRNIIKHSKRVNENKVHFCFHVKYYYIINVTAYI